MKGSASALTRSLVLPALLMVCCLLQSVVLADIDPGDYPANIGYQGINKKYCKQAGTPCCSLPGENFCRTITGVSCTIDSQQKTCYGEKTRKIRPYGACASPDNPFFESYICCDQFDTYYCAITQGWEGKVGTDCVNESTLFWYYSVNPGCAPQPAPTLENINEFHICD